MMITQIIFDLDGTLVDSLEIFIKIGNEMAEKYGYKSLNEEKITELFRLPMKKRIESLKIPIYKLPKMGIEALSAYNAYAAQVKPIEGVKEMLECLHKKGLRLNIISSNSLHNINTFLNANELDFFDNIQSSKGLFGKHITIGKLISKLGVKKEQVIYIGDEQRDVEACKKIGIKVISVLWGFDSLDLIEKSNPDFIVANPKEIVEIIKILNKSREIMWN
ncbi:MAG: HAD-IA family hydrolase [Ruminiclostridium sp.]